MINSQDSDCLIANAIHGDIRHRGACFNPMIFKVIANALQVRCGGRRPADAHASREQHLLYACVHLFFLNELALVGLSDSFLHGCANARLFLKQAQNGILHQFLSAHTGMAGDFRKLTFLLGREMYFHVLQGTPTQPTYATSRISSIGEVVTRRKTGCLNSSRIPRPIKPRFSSDPPQFEPSIVTSTGSGQNCG